MAYKQQLSYTKFENSWQPCTIHKSLCCEATKKSRQKDYGQEGQSLPPPPSLQHDTLLTWFITEIISQNFHLALHCSTSRCGPVERTSLNAKSTKQIEGTPESLSICIIPWSGTRAARLSFTPSKPKHRPSHLPSLQASQTTNLRLSADRRQASASSNRTGRVRSCLRQNTCALAFTFDIHNPLFRHSSTSFSLIRSFGHHVWLHHQQRF